MKKLSNPETGEGRRVAESHAPKTGEVVVDGFLLQ